MEITAANLQALRVTFSKVYGGAFDVADNWYSQVATTMPSGARLNTYGWMNNLPMLREWQGERHVHNVSEVSYQIYNKKYELTYALSRSDIEDDAGTLGIYNTQFEDLGRNAKKHPDVLVATAASNGQNVACFDGQPFFSTSHPVSTVDPALGTYSNYSASGMALTAANFNTVFATMASYQSAGGVRLGVTPDTLLVPPQLRVAARKICEMEMIESDIANVYAPISNVYKGMAKVVVAEELAAYPTAWYLLCTKRSVKPFVYQLRKATEFSCLVNLTDPNVFDNDEFKFGCYVRDNAGYSLPFLAYKALA